MKLNTNMKRALAAAVCLVLAAICSCGYPREYRYEGGEDGVNGVEIYMTSWRMRAGGAAMARLLIIYSSGLKSLHEGEGVVWESSDTGVASIDAGGSIAALAPGAVSITARLGDFSASHDLAVGAAMDCSQMLLGEILYDTEGEPGAEYIEIENRSDCECELSGWSLVDGAATSTRFVFPEQSIIAPRGRAVIAHTREVYSAAVGTDVLFGDMKFALNNSNETVFLYAADGTLVDCVYYEGGSAAFPAPEGWGSLGAARGLSLHRLPSDDTDTAADWMAGEPTPGR